MHKAEVAENLVDRVPKLQRLDCTANSRPAEAFYFPLDRTLFNLRCFLCRNRTNSFRNSTTLTMLQDDGIAMYCCCRTLQLCTVGVNKMIYSLLLIIR